jgi:hypothetical protein
MCYNLYRTIYNKHLCATCRNPLPIYEGGLDEELNNVFVSYMKKYIYSKDEEAKYNNIVELIRARQVSAYTTYINNIIYEHHKQCKKVNSAILCMLVVCIIYIALAVACVLCKSPTYEQHMAIVPSGCIALYIIIKLCRLDYYIDYMMFHNY